MTEEIEMKIFKSIEGESFSNIMPSLVIVISQLLVKNVKKDQIDHAVEMLSLQIKQEIKFLKEFLGEEA